MSFQGMRRIRRLLGAAIVVTAMGMTESPAYAQTGTAAQALHVLNRLAYGPTKQDLAHVAKLGIDGYIDEQLHPQRVPLPTSLLQQLTQLDTTTLSQGELVTKFREAAEAVKTGGEEAKARRRELLQRVGFEAAEARMLRAIHSPRQLEEVMVDFWFNHFNVFSGKGLDHVLVENYEREAIRPHALGRFRDLLGATAHHPAMLFYLDNWLSAAPGYQPAMGRGQGLGQGRGQGRGKVGGLNENYARELMELHTLGVDGGYTQKDVTELARIFTGWTLRPRASADSLFVFDERRHDPGDKQWLGYQVRPRGQAEGEWALDVLARHPATARHIAFELAQYFVADKPPAPLVQRLSKRFSDTDGDIRAVLKTLFDSPEFRDPTGKKFKTPYQYVISAIRSADVPVSNVRPLLAALAQLGMPLYGCQTPDGYQNTEEAWLNPDAITRRASFVTALASGSLPLARPIDSARTQAVAAVTMPQGEQQPVGRVNSEWRSPPPDVHNLLATLGDSISARTRAKVEHAPVALQAALVLGSPDFMYR